jgi:hypothetical protein
MRYEPDPGAEAPAKERIAFEASCEVRQTLIRVITVHLKDGAAVSWQGRNFDFTGIVFDGGSFEGADFSGGTVMNGLTHPFRRPDLRSTQCYIVVGKKERMVLVEHLIWMLYCFQNRSGRGPSRER